MNPKTAINDSISQAIISFNFEFIKDEFINQDSFCDFVLYGYYTIVQFLLQNSDVDVNKLVISKINIFFIKFLTNNIFLIEFQSGFFLMKF